MRCAWLLPLVVLLALPTASAEVLCGGALAASVCTSASSGSTTSAEVEASAGSPSLLLLERSAGVEASGYQVVFFSRGNNPANDAPFDFRVEGSPEGTGASGWTCVYYAHLVEGSCYDYTTIPSVLSVPDAESYVQVVVSIVERYICAYPRPHLCMLG